MEKGYKSRERRLQSRLPVRVRHRSLYTQGSIFNFWT